MELKDTIELMQSSDYKERFKAEYQQTKIRHDGLHKMLVKWDAGKLEFTPTCPKALLMEQKWDTWYLSWKRRTSVIRRWPELHYVFQRH